MSKNTVTSLADAIAKLEDLSQSKTEHLKDHLERDYAEIKKALDSLSPYLDDIKSKVEKEASAAKEKIEVSVKENPLVALGIVGLIAFFIGLFLGRSKK